MAVDEELQAAMQEEIRFETRVPRHIRERLNTVARLLRVSQGEALAVCVQALEATLPNLDALQYAQLLRRRICAPEGAGRRSVFSAAELPELPSFVPPLGVTYDRSEILDAAIRGRIASLLPSKPALRKGPVPEGGGGNAG